MAGGLPTLPHLRGAEGTERGAEGGKRHKKNRKPTPPSHKAAQGRNVAQELPFPRRQCTARLPHPTENSPTENHREREWKRRNGPQSQGRGEPLTKKDRINTVSTLNSNNPPKTIGNPPKREKPEFKTDKQQIPPLDTHKERNQRGPGTQSAHSLSTGTPPLLPSQAGPPPSVPSQGP